MAGRFRKLVVPTRRELNGHFSAFIGMYWLFPGNDVMSFTNMYIHQSQQYFQTRTQFTPFLIDLSLLKFLEFFNI